MAKINNVDMLNNARKTLKIAIGENTPEFIEDKARAVVVINDSRKVNFIETASASASGTNTVIFTTPSDRDFYLTSAGMSFIKDAACDTANGVFTLKVYVNGAQKNLLNLPILTLTAQSMETSQSFNIPVKLDRSTTVTLNYATHTAGNYLRQGRVSGIVEDTSI